MINAETIYRQAMDLKIEAVMAFVDESNELQGTKDQRGKDYHESLRRLVLDLLVTLQGIEYERDAIQDGNNKPF